MNLQEKIYQEIQKEIQKYDDKTTMAMMRKLTLVSTALFSALVSSGSFAKDVEEHAIHAEVNRSKMVESGLSMIQPNIEYVPFDKVNQLKVVLEDYEIVKEQYENTLNLSEDEKIEKILERFGLSDIELNIIIACVKAESKWGSYEDAYAVINTIYNRTLSPAWVRSHGTSLFKQCTAPGQFVVYEEGIYKQYLNLDRNDPCFKAIIDFLYTQESMHNYLSFRSNESPAEGRVQFVENGNRYFSVLKEEERLEEQPSIQEEQQEKWNNLMLKYTH